MNNQNLRFIRIRTTRELIELITSKSPDRFVMLLNYGLQSVKQIQYDTKRKIFWVYNEIDDTEQILTSGQLMSRKYTNIGRAMRAGAFFAEVPT